MISNRQIIWLCTIIFGAALAGCGGDQGPATSTALRGKVTKGGQPLAVDSAKYGPYAHVEVRLIPAEGTADVKYSANAKPDGSFELAVYEDQPRPTGKYRVAVFQWNPAPEKDDLKGQFDEKNTTIVRDIAPGQTELLIDLDKPQG